jgi:hypothetical protein
MSQVFTSLLCCVSLAAPAPAPGVGQPDKDNYCVIVEPVVAGDDLAIYRIQIVTEGKREVSVHFSDGWAMNGFSRADPDGKLHRAEFVLQVSLRPPDDLKDAAGKVVLERRVRLVGTDSSLNWQTADVNAKTKVKDVLQLKGQSSTQKLGKAFTIGQLSGKPLQVQAE